jgi:hypothetical protein
MDEWLFERTLAQMGSRVEFPATPLIAPTVTARLEADRVRKYRPRVPALALWSRRRAVVALALAVLLLASVALAASLRVGAIAIHVGPPRQSAPPAAYERGAALGRSVSLTEARVRAGFSIFLPKSLPAPDGVFLSRMIAGERMVVFAWRPGTSLPTMRGTGWGLVLVELPGDQVLATKELGSGNRLEAVKVGADSGYWITGPHDLIVRTVAGERSLRVTGNVLIWQVGSVTLRLESGLTKSAALQLARSTG